MIFSDYPPVITKIMEKLFNSPAASITNIIYTKAMKKNELIRWNLAHGMYAYGADTPMRYDIPSPKRLRRAVRLCEQMDLRRVQKSVFLGKLSAEEAVSFREKALLWLASDEDKLLMIPISRDDLSESVDLGVDCGVGDLLQRRATLIL